MDDKNQDNRTDDDYQAASQATASEEYNQYAAHATTYKQKHRNWKPLIIIGVLALLLIGFVVYWFVLRDTKSTPPQTAQDTKTPTEQQTTQGITAETKHHNSSAFMLEFDYPADWTVSEETGSGTLIARSPTLQLKSASNASFNGRVVFTIRNKQQPLPEFDAGNATAALNSQKIDYTKPSSVQRGSTYLSFLRYAASANQNGLDGIYVTGDTGYQKEQAIPKADFTPVDPILSLTFEKCSGTDCQSATSTSVATAMWQDAAFAKPLTALFQSLVVN